MRDVHSRFPVVEHTVLSEVSLRENLGRDIEGMFIALTSPPLVYKDLFIVGGRLSETLPCPPGDIRAYDVRTGKLRWSFHTIPRPGEFGYNAWPKDAWKTSGAANNKNALEQKLKDGKTAVPPWLGRNAPTLPPPPALR